MKLLALQEALEIRDMAHQDQQSRSEGEPDDRGRGMKNEHDEREDGRAGHRADRNMAGQQHSNGKDRDGDGGGYRRQGDEYAGGSGHGFAAFEPQEYGPHVPND